jgi:hypothetical protein
VSRPLTADTSYQTLSFPILTETMESNRSQQGPDSNPVPPPAANTATNEQIAAILARLSDFERRLDIVNPTPHHSASPASDIAAMRSLLVPAMQGGHSTPRASPADPVDETPIYDERYHQTHNDIMESVSLRRDLSHPENPPFGLWWTFTVEETLLWPILGFRGNVNSSLDAVMLGSREDEEGEEGEVGFAGSRGAEYLRARPQGSSPGDLSGRGLDDGTVVPGLIESFLSNVHTKCPILDPQSLRSYAANLVENGPGWNAKTCQVVSLSPWRVTRVAYTFTATGMRLGSYFVPLEPRREPM